MGISNDTFMLGLVALSDNRLIGKVVGLKGSFAGPLTNAERGCYFCITNPPIFY